MKKAIFTFLCILSVTLLRASDKEIIARVAIENMTEQELTSGKFFIAELNKTIEITSEESFTVTLPEKGKYKFGFYSHDFEAYTYYPGKMSDRKNTITIRLERKAVDSAQNKVFPLHKPVYLSNEQIEDGIKEGEVNFILHSLNSSPINFMEFKEKYGIGFVTENCVIDPVTYRRAMENNLRIQEYLNEKYGADWKVDLPTKPFGIE